MRDKIVPVGSCAYHPHHRTLDFRCLTDVLFPEPGSHRTRSWGDSRACPPVQLRRAGDEGPRHPEARSGIRHRRFHRRIRSFSIRRPRVRRLHTIGRTHRFRPRSRSGAKRRQCQGWPRGIGSHIEDDPDERDFRTRPGQRTENLSRGPVSRSRRSVGKKMESPHLARLPTIGVNTGHTTSRQVNTISRYRTSPLSSRGKSECSVRRTNPATRLTRPMR